MSFVPTQDEIPDDHLVDASDSGWRKYVLTVVVMGILSWGYWAANNYPVLSGLYATFGGMILAAAGLYFSANVASKIQGGIINLKAYPLTNGDAPKLEVTSSTTSMSVVPAQPQSLVPPSQDGVVPPKV
jgi:hypothetical protein